MCHVKDRAVEGASVADIGDESVHSGAGITVTIAPDSNVVGRNAYAESVVGTVTALCGKRVNAFAPVAEAFTVLGGAGINAIAVTIGAAVAIGSRFIGEDGIIPTVFGRATRDIFCALNLLSPKPNSEWESFIRTRKIAALSQVRWTMTWTIIFPASSPFMVRAVRM